MTIFTSKRPEDFDPEPWVVFDIDARQLTSDRYPSPGGYRRPGTPEHYELRHDPRPHFQPTRDELPWADSHGSRIEWATRESIDHPELFDWLPRPEFTTPGNPILVDLRAMRNTNAFSDDPRGLYRSWAHTFRVTAKYGPEVDAVIWKGKTTEQIEHARKVLSRLAAL